MKWIAIAALVAAVLIKLLWHTSMELAVRVSPTTHRGYPIVSIVFWVLLTAAAVSGFFSLVRRPG